MALRVQRVLCGSCGEEMDGYSPPELVEIGWRWHRYGAGESFFVMCEACEARFAARRLAAA